MYPLTALCDSVTVLWNIIKTVGRMENKGPRIVSEGAACLALFFTVACAAVVLGVRGYAQDKGLINPGASKPSTPAMF